MSELEAAFEQHRRELHVHCYRMLGSYDDAEDLTQETFLRAWRKRETYAQRASLRAWLYRIATNACLDLIARRDTTLAPLDAASDAPAPVEQLPEAIVCRRETVELVLLAATRHLSPPQDAAFLLHDVLRRSAAESATAQSISVPATNSAVQRARRVLRAQLPVDRLDWARA